MGAGRKELWARGSYALPLAAALLLAAAVDPGDDAARAEGHAPPIARGASALALERVGTFDSPTYVDSAPGRHRLLFVTELTGAIRVIRERTTLPDPFLDLTPRVRSGGESGLLSMAFHPNYRQNRRFYVAYIDRSNDIRVDRFRTSRDDPTRALPGSGQKVIVVQHPPDLFHYGGQLEFGPDGFLYLSTGDGWAGGGSTNAQDATSLLGKILRIMPRRGGGYEAALGNPFIDAPGRDEIFALGLRNPSRFSFDGDSLWIGDVGQDSWEEIDRISISQAGANFGWNLYEGNHPFKAGISDPVPPAYQPPVYEYANARSTCAVIGGYVVRDPALPALAGAYVFSDFCDGALRALTVAPGSMTVRPLGLTVSTPTSFGEGVRDRIYVASLDGGVFQLVQTR